MDTTSSAIQIYVRHFHRTGTRAFEDVAADETFAKEHFVDFFGKTWLPNHINARSLDDILQAFYGELQT